MQESDNASTLWRLNRDEKRNKMRKYPLIRIVLELDQRPGDQEGSLQAFLNLEPERLDIVVNVHLLLGIDNARNAILPCMYLDLLCLVETLTN
jgi:hypothetical protein